MITYVLSEQNGAWHVHRHSENISPIASGITNEQEAFELAMTKAKEDKPSRVMRIAVSGDNKIVAEFN